MNLDNQSRWTLKYTKLKKLETKCLYCKIPFIWNIQKRKYIKTENKISGFLGLGWEQRVTENGLKGFWGIWKSSKIIDCGDGGVIL